MQKEVLPFEIVNTLNLFLMNKSSPDVLFLKFVVKVKI